MTVNHLTSDSLVRVAAAGGGVRLAAGKYTSDSLVRIAAAGSSTQARITIENSKALTSDSMVRIAAAGKGCVSFE